MSPIWPPCAPLQWNMTSWSWWPWGVLIMETNRQRNTSWGQWPFWPLPASHEVVVVVVVVGQHVKYHTHTHTHIDWSLPINKHAQWRSIKIQSASVIITQNPINNVQWWIQSSLLWICTGCDFFSCLIGSIIPPVSLPSRHTVYILLDMLWYFNVGLLYATHACNMFPVRPLSYDLMIRYFSKHLMKWIHTLPVVFPVCTSSVFKFFYLSSTFLWGGPFVTFRCHWRNQPGKGQLQRCELWIQLLYLFSHHSIPWLFFFFLHFSFCHTW